MALSLRDRQLGCLKRILNMNNPVKRSSTHQPPQWKVLVYDRTGQEILSPLLSVKELRELGVTLHLLLHSDRDVIDNIQRICDDLNNRLYETYHLNFISALPRPLIEDLASSALRYNCVTQISKLWDQYINFISLEDDLFTLRHSRTELSFYNLNNPLASDTEIEAAIDSIVDGLLSVCVVAGVIPLIRCSPGNAAEMVAERLDKKIRENLKDPRNSLFANDVVPGSQVAFQSHMMILVDRCLDMTTPLHHTWTYQALMHDVLTFSLNKLSITSDGHKTISYDLNSSVDKFWNAQRCSSFPEVAQAVQSELEAYRAAEQEIKALQSVMGHSGEGEFHPDATSKLTSALSSLPELLDRKRVIDMHTNIATTLLDCIKDRKLDVFFETEEKILSKSTLERSIIDIIADPDIGSPDDKLRLFVIYLLSSKESISSSEIDSYKAALTDAGCSDLTAVDYLSRHATLVSQAPLQQGGGVKTMSMFSKLMSQGSQFVMEGVKNLAVKKHRLPLTTIVDRLCEYKPDPVTDKYRTFDPKLLRPGSETTRSKGPVNDVIVCVIGGGNYSEYQNLVEYATAKDKRLTYGATELDTPAQFLSYVTKLGE